MLSLVIPVYGRSHISSENRPDARSITPSRSCGRIVRGLRGVREATCPRSKNSWPNTLSSAVVRNQAGTAGQAAGSVASYLGFRHFSERPLFGSIFLRSLSGARTNPHMTMKEGFLRI